MKLADAMLIGGAMAYTFLKSQGLQVGRSLVEDDKLDLARGLLDEATQTEISLLLPVDHVVAESPDSAETKIYRHREHAGRLDGSRHRPRNDRIVRQEVSKARTIVWNGPLGMFEKPAFAEGTLAMARAVAAATKAGATSIVGGGDSVAAVEQSGVAAADFAHFDGRRRFAGISRRRKAPGRRSAHRRAKRDRLSENEKEF